MDVEELTEITRRWSEKVGKNIKECPPEARFVTGDQLFDTQLYHFEKESGLSLKLSNAGVIYRILDYRIVDEKKFAWFLMRWS